MEIFAWERTLAFVKSRGHGTLINFYRWIALRAASEREREKEKEREGERERVSMETNLSLAAMRHDAPRRAAPHRGNNLFDDFSV